MSEWISNHIVTVLLAVIALFAGIVVTVRLVNKSRKNTNKVKQSGIRAGGDIAGRDINKK